MSQVTRHNHVTIQPSNYPIFLYVFLVSLLLFTLACDLSTITSLIPSTISGKPETAIQSPPSNSEFREGELIAIQSQSTDRTGIARVELLVDGAVAQTDQPPLAGQESYTLVQRWTATAGTHTIVVQSYNSKGAASNAASVVVVVTAAPIVARTVAPTQQALATQPSPATPAAGTTSSAPRTATTTRTPTLRAQATNTPNVAPGVYGVSVRVDPPEPKRGAFVTFFVTFLNTTGEPKGYRWFIKVFEPDKTSSFGETSKKQEDIPVGRSELASPADWKVTGPGPCQQYIARVFWFIPDSKEVGEFAKPDLGGGPAVGFQVCP